MWIHRITGFIIWATTASFAFYVIIKDNWEIDNSLHPICGLMTLSLVTLLSFGGVLSKWMLENSRWNTKKAIMIKTGHGIFGFVVIVFSHLTLLFGCLRYAENGVSEAKTLGIVGFVLFFTILALLEIWHQVFKRKETPFIDADVTITRE